MGSASRRLPTFWRKALRDLWRERTRTFLVVLAIALGIAAFSTVLSTYAILVRELDQGYLATNPASAVLRTDAVDDALLAGVVSNHAVAEAEARRTVTGRIKSGPVEWRSLRLFVVKDYGDIRVSKLVPQQGAWPPATGEILIERDAFQVAKTRIGDTVTVRLAGGEQMLRVTGSVHDVGQAQARMENVVYGYITLDTLALLGEQPYLDQLTLVVSGNTLDEAHVKSVAESVKRWIESQGHPVRRMDVPAPGKHLHSDIMGLLLLAQAAFGLFALLLSGILVVNLVTAMMASELRQIGVMKAIGGTRRQIASIYLAQGGLLGLFAFLIAVPVGIWGSRVFCRYMAVFLNFDINSFAVPAWVYLLDAAVGLVVPLLAAAYPVARGTGSSVREALADAGTAQVAFGTTAFDRLLARRGGLGRPLLLAVRNSFRRRVRMALTVATLAAAGLFFMTALNVRASLIRTLDRLFDSRKFDLNVSLASLYPFDRVERALRRVPEVRHTEGWITVEATISDPAQAPDKGGVPHAPPGGLHTGGASGARFSVIALPAQTRMLALDIVEGRGLQPGDIDALVMNTALRDKAPHMKVGSLVPLRMGPEESSWRIVGNAREPFSPATAYISRSYFDRIGGHAGMANSVRLALDKSDPASIAGVKAALDRRLEEEGLRATGSAAKGDGRYSFDQHMLMIYVFLIVMSAILLGVGGLGLMTTMSLNVLERRREMGVLRAIGATPRMVGLIVVAEGTTVSLLSWALAATAAWPVGKAVGDSLVSRVFRSRLDFAFELQGLALWLGVAVLTAAVASVLPAWHASRRPVREAIGYE